MANWRSYDSVAREYDRVWGDRFEEAARHLWSQVPLRPGAALLDIGTGTGVVPRTLGARTNHLSRLIGCDLSQDMLAEATARLPGLRAVAADARRLPFAEGTFDVVTASFVLSHLPDYRAGMAEAHRVLKRSGTFVTTSWTAKTDPRTEAWDRLLAEVVSADRLQAASAEVTPSEAQFERAENVSTALTEAGFTGVEARTFEMRARLSLEQFLSDRELSSGGRFAKDALGPSVWQRFLDGAGEELGRSFAGDLTHSRGIHVGLGRRP